MAERVVVIGAGMGGLAAAARLAHAGMSVTVLEAHDGPGGKVGSVWIDGVRCDTGPSVLTMPDVLQELFQSCGRELPVTLRALDPCFRYRWPDGVDLDVHHHVDDTIAATREVLGSSAAQQLRDFLTYAAGIWELAAPAFVYGPAPSLSTFFRMGVGQLGQLPRLDALRSMASAIRSRVQEPHLRDLLLRYATYNGSDPRVAPATLNCIASVELEGGCFGVEGGMAELAVQLEALCLDLGVELRYGEPVRAVHTASGRVAAVHTDLARFDTRWVVGNADVAHLARLVEPLPAPSLPPSTSGYTALLRAAAAGDLRPHEVIFPERYDREFSDLFDGPRAPSDPTVYVCAQDRAHGVGRWGGTEPLFVMANAPSTQSASDDPALAERVSARLRALGIEGDVCWERHPHDLARAYPDTGGALYGVASNSRFAAFRRPANRSPVAGLYLASGSAHPGGGVPLCLLSGRQAAASLLADRPSS